MALYFLHQINHKEELNLLASFSMNPWTNHIKANYRVYGSVLITVAVFAIKFATRYVNSNGGSQLAFPSLRVIKPPLYFGYQSAGQLCSTISHVRWEARQLVPIRQTPPSYSEFGQDLWIYNNIVKPLHLDTENGTFVEFGARDGIEGSNSYYFENELHWTGLLVEGLKSEFHKLVVNRPNIHTIKANGLLCSEPGQREFIWATGDVKYQGWGGFKEELIRSGALEALLNAQKTNSTIKIKRKLISCLSLNGLLEEAGMKDITLLSADCEGCELEVFSSLDWESYRPSIILTEKAGDAKRLCEIIELLVSKGYRPVNWSSSDVIFVRDELVDKLNL